MNSLAEVGVKDEFWRHSGIGATQDRGIRMLPLGEVRQRFFANSGKAGLSSKEPLVTSNQAGQCFLG